MKDGGRLYTRPWRRLVTARRRKARQAGGNVYNLRELAGAVGDLGTLIPFLVGYLTINKLDPAGVLVAFGLFKIIAGLHFKTPIPIQPMKAIGTAAISHAGALTAGSIWAAGVFTGLFWLIMGLTGAVSWIAKITSRPIVQGLILGLGLGFILEGVRMMEASLGGVPMCHGAGGMAAHIRFGAPTGGALVILGSVVLCIGLFFADSVATIFKLFPRALLGVILMFGGLELAAGMQGSQPKKTDRYVTLLTAGVSLWNMGVGYVAGLVLWHAYQRGWFKG